MDSRHKNLPRRFLWHVTFLYSLWSYLNIYEEFDFFAKSCHDIKLPTFKSKLPFIVMQFDPRSILYENLTFLCELPNITDSPFLKMYIIIIKVQQKKTVQQKLFNKRKNIELMKQG